MKKKFKLTAMCFIAATSAFMASCSSNDGPLQDLSLAKHKAEYIIDFEKADSKDLAGPTSYGENLYSKYGDKVFKQWETTISEGKTFACGINMKEGKYDYWNGGIVISNWNIRANHGEHTGDWWYSYKNQCSVYNTLSADGTNSGGGHGGSDKFGVMYGYSDSHNAGHISNPEFHFNSGVQFTVGKMYVCNSSYSYGVMLKGNQFAPVPLEEAKGWFKVLAYGYDAKGQATNGGKPVEKYICDYRDSATPKMPLQTTWQEWDLSALGPVNKVKFNFEGSDSGNYGLNTPAYLCIDDIHISQ